MARKPTDAVNLRLRLPDALRAQLAAEAEKNARSLNGEILFRLGQTMSDQWQEFIAGQVQREADEREWAEQITQSPQFQEMLAKFIREQNPQKRKNWKEKPE